MVNHWGPQVGKADGGVQSGKTQVLLRRGDRDAGPGHLLLGTAGGDTLALDATQADIRTIVAGGGQDELVIDSAFPATASRSCVWVTTCTSRSMRRAPLAMVMNHYGASGSGQRHRGRAAPAVHRGRRRLGPRGSKSACRRGHGRYPFRHSQQRHLRVRPWCGRGYHRAPSTIRVPKTRWSLVSASGPINLWFKHKVAKISG